MRRFVPRSVLAASLLASVVACSSGGGSGGVALGSDTGGRYLVMIPALEGPSGEQVANDLRGLVTGMTTHAALNDGDVRRQMAEYEIEALNEVFALQLAQVLNVQLVSWGQVRQAGAGLEADVKFVDSRSGDAVNLTGLRGATPTELASAIFASFEESVEGIRQAAFCNDYLSSSNYTEALSTCEAALAIVPGSITALYGKATALLYLDRLQESLTTYDQLLAIDVTHQDALLGAGLAASRLLESQRAMTYYNRYLEVNPGNVQVRMTVAGDVVQAGDYVSAFRILETAIPDNADNTDFQTYLFQVGSAAGRRLREEGDTATAQQVLTTAYTAFERGYGTATDLDQSVLQRVIEVTVALGRTDEALRLASEATTRFPNEVPVWSVYATALREAGRTDEEIQALTRMTEIDPQNAETFIRRAQAHNRAGNRSAAIADGQRIAALGDRDRAAQVLFSIGAPMFQANNYAEAEPVLAAAYEHATGTLRSDVAFYRSYSLLQQGVALRNAATTSGNLQQFQQALAFMQRALPLIQASSNAQAPAIAENIQANIANIEAVIGSMRR